MKFEQIVIHDWSKERQIEGVLNFKIEDIASFTSLREEPKYYFLRIKGGNDRAYIVEQKDLDRMLCQPTAAT